MSEKKEFTFERKLRMITNTMGFSIPHEILPELEDKPRGKTWRVTLREV